MFPLSQPHRKCRWSWENPRSRMTEIQARLEESSRRIQRRQPSLRVTLRVRMWKRRIIAAPKLFMAPTGGATRRSQSNNSVFPPMLERCLALSLARKSISLFKCTPRQPPEVYLPKTVVLERPYLRKDWQRSRYRSQPLTRVEQSLQPVIMSNGPILSKRKRPNTMRCAVNLVLLIYHPLRRKRTLKEKPGDGK